MKFKQIKKRQTLARGMNNADVDPSANLLLFEAQIVSSFRDAVIRRFIQSLKFVHRSLFTCGAGHNETLYHRIVMRNRKCNAVFGCPSGLKEPLQLLRE